MSRSRWPRWVWLENWRQRPDRASALQRYARLASGYEASARHIQRVRRRAIDLLGLRPGERVFDVACGAGALLRALAGRVGDAGQVVGIEQSPEMAALARAASQGLRQVEVMECAVEDAQPAQPADALLLCYTHDVIQNPQALRRLFAHTRPGARVVVVGLCTLPWWGLPANLWMLWRARHYMSTWHGLREPWAPLRGYCDDLRIIERYHLGLGYIATGIARPPDKPHP